MCKFKFTLIVLLVSCSHSVIAAPCCSSSAAVPSVVSGDDEMQMTFTTARSTVIGDVSDEGRPVFRSADDSEISQTYRLDMARVFDDRYQGGVSLPVVDHEVNRLSSHHQSMRFGDIRLTGAYEAMPEWSYSSWKPKGFGFFQLTLPTGRSIYDSQEIGAVDSSGQGFYRFALGGLFTKNRGAWDFYFIPEVHYSFSRTFGNSDGGEVTRVAPGLGSSIAVGAGFSPHMGNLRIGFRLQPLFSQSKKIDSSLGKSETAKQEVWDTSLEAAYLLTEAWTVLSSYTDQTLLGPARNSTLSRTFSLGVQHRWAR